MVHGGLDQYGDYQPKKEVDYDMLSKLNSKKKKKLTSKLSTKKQTKYEPVYDDYGYLTGVKPRR